MGLAVLVMMTVVSASRVFELVSLVAERSVDWATVVVVHQPHSHHIDGNCTHPFYLIS